MKLVCRALIPLVLLLLAVACGDDAPPRYDGAAQTCDPYSCSGCCLNGACQQGNTDNACGTGGYGCNVCTTNQVCKLGLCQPKTATCGPSNCASGCCMGASCMGGSSVSSCGKSGGACKMCKSNEKCINGGCVPTSGSCGASNCSSGCCQNNQCKSGSASSACGTGGGQCKVCQSNQKCQNGACVPSTGSCGPSNCSSGCCENNQCKSGTASSACGTGGASCKACKSTEKCQAGACVPSSGTCDSTSCSTGCCQNNTCKSGTSITACGTGGAQCKACKSTEKCQAGACTGSGPTLYKVYLKSAKVDSPWLACAESNCDLYVKLTVGGATATSTIKADNNNPVWNQYLLVAADSSLKASFKATVYDDDYGPDPTVGGCTGTITSSVLAAGKVELQCTYLTVKVCKVTFSFVKN